MGRRPTIRGDTAIARGGEPIPPRHWLGVNLGGSRKRLEARRPTPQGRKEGRPQQQTRHQLQKHHKVARLKGLNRANAGGAAATPDRPPRKIDVFLKEARQDKAVLR